MAILEEGANPHDVGEVVAGADAAKSKDIEVGKHTVVFLGLAPCVVISVADDGGSAFVAHLVAKGDEESRRDAEVDADLFGNHINHAGDTDVEVNEIGLDVDLGVVGSAKKGFVECGVDFVFGAEEASGGADQESLASVVEDREVDTQTRAHAVGEGGGGDFTEVPVGVTPGVDCGVSAPEVSFVWNAAVDAGENVDAASAETAVAVILGFEHGEGQSES